MQLQSNRKKIKRDHSNSHILPLKQTQLNQSSNQQYSSHQTPKRNSYVRLSIKAKQLVNQYKPKLQQTEDFTSKLVHLVQNLTKGIQQQVNKIPKKPTANAIELKFDALMMHRFQQVSQAITQYKKGISEIPNPECSTNHMQYAKKELKMDSPNQNRGSKGKQRDHLQQLIVKFVSKNSSLSHLSSSDSAELLRALFSKYQELQRENNQRLRENKKIRLYYMNQINHYKEEVKFVHQILNYQSLQIKQLTNHSISSSLYLKNHPYTTHYQLQYAKNDDSQMLFNLTEKRLKEYQQLLLKMKAQLQEKGQSLIVLTSQVSLLQDNLIDLTEKVMAKQQLLEQRTAYFSELQSDIDAQERRFSELQQKVSSLREQVQLEQQHLDFIQQQLYAMEEKQIIINSQIQELSHQKTALLKQLVK